MLFISQLYDNAQVNQDVKVRFLGSNKNKDLKRLNKLETKFTALEKKISSLKNKQHICKESKQFISIRSKKLKFSYSTNYFTI